MDPEIQKAVTNLVVVMLTILGAALTTWWQNKTTKKKVDTALEQQKTDTDVVFTKVRYAEQRQGYQTIVNPQTKELVDVTANPPFLVQLGQAVLKYFAVKFGKAVVEEVTEKVEEATEKLQDKKPEDTEKQAS